MSGKQNLSTLHSSPVPLEFEVYERSRSDIRRLKEKLPEELVVSMASEVLRRLALRDKKFEQIRHDPSVEELERFCVALLSDNETEAAEIIVSVRADGTSAEVVYLKYLAAAARMLGKWWDTDRVSFAKVAIGTSRLFAIMRAMKHLFVPTAPLQNKSAIFASVPGDDHTLGVRMAADLFRKEGWEITLMVGMDHDQLIANIEQSPIDIIGLSVGGRHSVDALSRLVVALHISCPQSALLVSGQNIEGVRQLLTLMGVDNIARDIDEAKEEMAKLLNRNVARSN